MMSGMPAAAFGGVVEKSAFDGMGGGDSAAPRVRSNFPETWLWDSLDSGLVQFFWKPLKKLNVG